MVEAKGGPTKYDVEDIQQWLEVGYICGSKVPFNKFMFRGNYFVVTILSHNITITWVVINKRQVAEAEYLLQGISAQYDIHFRMSCRMLK